VFADFWAYPRASLRMKAFLSEGGVFRFSSFNEGWWVGGACLSTCGIVFNILFALLLNLLGPYVRLTFKKGIGRPFVFAYFFFEALCKII